MSETCLVCGVHPVGPSGFPSLETVTGFRGAIDSTGRQACGTCGGTFPSERVEAMKRISGPFEDIQQAFAGLLAGVLPDGRPDPRPVLQRLLNHVGREFYVGPQADPMSRTSLVYALVHPREGLLVLIRTQDAKLHALRLRVGPPETPNAEEQAPEPQTDPAPKGKGKGKAAKDPDTVPLQGGDVTIGPADVPDGGRPGDPSAEEQRA